MPQSVSQRYKVLFSLNEKGPFYIPTFIITNNCNSNSFYAVTIGIFNKYIWITSRIDYCNSLYVHLPKTTSNRLQRIMRCAARVVALPRYGESVTNVCKQLHWLPIRERAKFKILTLVYKSIHGSTPEYLSELIIPYNPPRELRSKSSNLLCVPKCRVKYGERAFSHAGPSLWNTLPSSIRNASSLAIFKKKLKTHLFTEAYC